MELVIKKYLNYNQSPSKYRGVFRQNVLFTSKQQHFPFLQRVQIKRRNHNTVYMAFALSLTHNLSCLDDKPQMNIQVPYAKTLTVCFKNVATCEIY